MASVVPFAIAAARADNDVGKIIGPRDATLVATLNNDMHSLEAQRAVANNDTAYINISVTTQKMMDYKTGELLKSNLRHVKYDYITYSEQIKNKQEQIAEQYSYPIQEAVSFAGLIVLGMAANSKIKNSKRIAAFVSNFGIGSKQVREQVQRDYRNEQYARAADTYGKPWYQKLFM